MLTRPALLACGIVLLSGCDTTAPAVRELVPFRVFPNAGRLFEPSDPDDPGLVPSIAVAIRSEAEEADLLSSYPRMRSFDGQGGVRYAPFPDVDYGAETALVITAVPAASTMSLRLDSVVAEGRQVTAYSTTVVPCVNTRDLINRSLVATIPGSIRGVTFAPRTVERPPCQ